jgi:activator of 2-hydroxyglutaryl-CoA dehydratase
MGVELKDLGEISQRSQNTVRISSTCTVFAETEVVSLVAVGTLIPDIVKGVHNSIATRAVALLRSLGIRHRRESGETESGPMGMSGGVALNSGVVKSLEEMLGSTIYIAENPQVRGAIGAAYIGQKMV